MLKGRILMDKGVEPISEEIGIMPQSVSEDIKSLILTVRGTQVLLDSDVALLYGYEVKNLNRAATRNEDRFPPEFRFQLTAQELEQVLRFQNGTSNSTDNTTGENRGGRRYLPYVYTEHGIIMLAGVLRNEKAVQVSIGITKAFVEMRRFIHANNEIFTKIMSIDNKLLEHDRKFDEVFDLLHPPEIIRQNIFYKGQFYDAYELIIRLVKKAKSSIIVIDNYANSSVLDMLTNKKESVVIVIITANPGELSSEHLKRFVVQYGAVEVMASRDFHDRFIIVDKNEVYAFGASLKDVGKKCFEVSKSEDPARFMAYVQSIIAQKRDAER